jgi:hypothetical protein
VLGPWILLELPRRAKINSVTRRVMGFCFQATALVWAVAVCLRTVDLGWNPFTGIGLGMIGAVPISLLGVRIHSKTSPQ